MNKPPKAMLSGSVPRPVDVPEDQLERLRAEVARVRDLRIEREGLEERAKAIGQDVYKAEHETLPEMFDRARVKTLGLEPAGNLPGFVAEVGPYFHANISAEWPEERRSAAFGWLDSNNHGDLIKTGIMVELPRGKEGRTKAKKLEAFLKKNKIPYTASPTVPWNTLTAFVRTEIEAGRPVPLDVLGATVGRVVKIKPAKTK